jgi:hypothetical protein
MPYQNKSEEMKQIKATIKDIKKRAEATFNDYGGYRSGRALTTKQQNYLRYL